MESNELTANNVGPGGKTAPGQKLLGIANTFLVLAIAVALTSVFVLARRNAKLRDERVRLIHRIQTASGTMAGPPSAQIGDLVPSFDSKDSRSSIRFDGKARYLFLIFSTQCEVCTGEHTTWKKIARHASSKAYRVISLSIYADRDDRGQISEIDESVENLAIPNLAIQRAYRVVAVPVVMLTSAEGQVQWVHYGHLSQEKLTELFAQIDGESK